MGQNFSIQNVTNVLTYSPTPPHVTPVSWLTSYGFDHDFAAAELSDPDQDGLLTWQEYIAGTNPRDHSSSLILTVKAPQSGQAIQLSFHTIAGRINEVQTTTNMSNWMALQEAVSGTGKPMTISDSRPLTRTNNAYYRVVVHP